jgi:hypothetical protein
MENKESTNQQTQQQSGSDPRIKPGQPNDFGSVQIDAHFKISDPNSKYVYVEGRA